MRILVHDFGGYAFPLELSRALAARGHVVCHAYCASHQTTPPGLDGASGDGLEIRPLHLRKPLNKYAWATRWRQEREYGRLIAGACKDFRPSVVLSGNTPLSAQHRLMKTCRAMRTPVIYWLQDIIGEATRRLLGKRLRLVGTPVGRYFQAMEGMLLRMSDAVIAISDDFVNMAEAMGVQRRRIHFIGNWAPLKHSPAPGAIPLAAEFAATPCLLYTGTLSMKHNPALLVHLAEAVSGRARVVVISQGMGADWLKEQKATEDLPALTILPYQPSEALPALYAAATVLVAVLEGDASVYSVPSKVLTYLAAGKPLLLAVPAANLAARIVAGAGAGLVVSPDDPEALGQAALDLLENEAERARMGQAARAYAEGAFDIERIADRFLTVAQQVTG